MLSDFLKKKDNEIAKNHITIFDADDGTNLYEHRSIVEKLHQELFKFGFTTSQSKIYIYLGKFGSKTAPEISKVLRLPRTETYHLLTTMQNRGILTAEFCSPAKFSIVPVDKALGAIVNIEREKTNLLSKRRNKVLDLWNDLPSSTMDVEQESKEKMQALQGVASLNNKIKMLINNCETEFHMLCSEKDLARFYHLDGFEILDTSTIKARFIISPAKEIPNFIEDADRHRIRTLQDEKNNASCFIIKDREEMLLVTKSTGHPDDITAIWTDSKSVINPMSMLFDCCWDKSKNCEIK
jgi:sugar-specific transcriptional regulator TrmB